MRATKRFLQFNATVLMTGGAFTAYYYPELRKEPLQLLLAMRRGMRVCTTGVMMASDYLKAGDDITSETHFKAAGRMFDMFCINGGPYIKLGQMFGQLENLMPKEYIETFEPMCMRAPTTPFEDVK